MKERKRNILHVDLDPFFVSVERSLDPGLRGRPVVVGGGTGPEGLVAAASAEARALGVRPGQTVRQALRLCPDAALRSGDLETYARFGADVTAIFLAASRRVLRPSADEAYLDLTPEGAVGPGPVAVAEGIKDQIQRRLGLDASLGLASSKLAARVASSWARPRGLLLVLPGYEASFVGRQALSFLDELPSHAAARLQGAGLTTLGQVAEAEEATLAALVGAVLAPRLRNAAREGEELIPVAAPPASVHEEATIRDRRSDAAALAEVVDGLARRAARRLRPFGLAAEQVAVEVDSADASARRSESFRFALEDEEAIAAAATALAEPLLEPAARVRGVSVRLGKLHAPEAQATLFSAPLHAGGFGG